jgi:threonine/homoserine/homoserine lactone efflux protein
MVENWLFLLAIIAILMIPGSGNALVANAAHRSGVKKTSLFIPAIIMGYIYAINGWALLTHLFSPIWPSFQTVIHILSSIWVGWMTFHLYKAHQLEKQQREYPEMTPWQMFFTTLKNPKAALMSAGILPSATWDNVQNFVLVFIAFALVVIPVAAFWMIYGQTILSHASDKIKADLMYKGSALFLLLCLIPLILHFD